MAVENFLTNRLLIAMPWLSDSIFYHAVIYICEQKAQGTIGLMINKPLQLSLNFIFDQLRIPAVDALQAQSPLLYGGPIQPERGFVIHRPEGIWNSSLVLGKDITITTSNDIIRAIAEGKGPKDALVALGYVSWDKDQLHQELSNNFWLDCSYDAKIMYQVPLTERWEYAASTLGINIHHLTNQAGHA